MRSISQQGFSEALQCLRKDIRSVKSTGQNQSTLDTANHFFGESLGFMWLASSPFQRSCKRVDPGGEVIADSVGKAIDRAIDTSSRVYASPSAAFRNLRSSTGLPFLLGTPKNHAAAIKMNPQRHQKRRCEEAPESEKP